MRRNVGRRFFQGPCSWSPALTPAWATVVRTGATWHRCDARSEARDTAALGVRRSTRSITARNGRQPGCAVSPALSRHQARGRRPAVAGGAQRAASGSAGGAHLLPLTARRRRRCASVSAARRDGRNQLAVGPDRAARRADRDVATTTCVASDSTASHNPRHRPHRSNVATAPVRTTLLAAPGHPVFRRHLGRTRGDQTVIHAMPLLDVKLALMRAVAARSSSSTTPVRAGTCGRSCRVAGPTPASPPAGAAQRQGRGRDVRGCQAAISCFQRGIVRPPAPSSPTVGSKTINALSAGS